MTAAQAVQQPVTIQIAIQPEQFAQFARDVLTQLVECDCIDYWDEDGTQRFMNVKRNAEGDVESFDLRYVDPKTGQPKTARFDIPAVGLMLQAVANPAFNVNSDTRAEILKAAAEADAGYIDVENADVMAQAYLFNELVYG